MAAVPSGSYLALYDSIDTNPAQIEALKKYAETGAVPYLLRPLEQIAQCFAGLKMVAPGLVPITQWRPDTAEVGTVGPIDAYGALARKP
jgi:hypothetical protein